MNSLRASRDSRAERDPGYARAAPARPLALLLFGVLPAALIVFTVLTSGGRATHFAGDFHYAFWPAGHRVLDGLSPYVNPSSPALAHAAAFVYPAFAALLLVPFSLIPHALADGVFAALELAAVVVTLRLLEVRDWRVYGLVLLTPSVFAGWTVANVTLALGLGVAACWRWRERALAAGLVLAALVSFKLFLWPLLLWPLATRRYATLLWAATGVVALNIVSWAVVGLGEIGRYTHLLDALVSAEERNGYSLFSLARGVGLERGLASALTLLAAGVAAVVCVALGRRGRDIDALALALAASLLATPIVQLHYYALLIVPLAVSRPRLGLAWAPLLLMWIAAGGSTQPWQIALALALGAAIVSLVPRPNLLTRARTCTRSHYPHAVGARASTFV